MRSGDPGGVTEAGGPLDGQGPLLTVVGLTDVRSVKTVLWPAFQQATGERAELTYRQEVDMPRLLGEVSGARAEERPDVVIVTNPMLFEQAGLLDRADGLADPRVPAAWTDQLGRWAPLYVQPIVVVYNAHYRLPPAGWSELLEPGWRSRLVFEEPARMLTSGPALAELHSVFGEATWQGFIGGLAAQDPLMVPDNERAVLEVASGAHWAGLANWNVAKRVRIGSPVRHVFLDPTPCVPGFGAVVKGSSAAELGRRFLRWLASDDGQAAYARTGRIPALPDADPALTTTSVVPTGIGRVLGSADWLHNPGHWSAAFGAAFPNARTSAGKLR